MSQRSYSLENTDLTHTHTPGISETSNTAPYEKKYSRRTEYNRRLSDEENLQRKIAAAAYMREYRARKKREQQGIPIYDHHNTEKRIKLVKRSKLVYIYNNDQHKAVIEELTNVHGPLNEHSDSNEFSICEPTDVNIKEEFEEESVECKEPSVEWISDDEQTISRFDREPSVECIIGDDEPMFDSKIKLESPQTDVIYEEPLQTDAVLRQIPFKTETVPKPIQCPEMPSVPSLPFNEINIRKQSRRKKLKNAQLKEIQKMHRNLLRESKKQTALLRKLVKEMQQ